MELKEYFSVLLKRLWLIILLPVIAGIVSAYINIYLLSPVYESNLTMYIINKDLYQQPETAYSELGIAKQLVKDYKEIILSRTVTLEVIRQLKLNGMTSEEIAKKIGVYAKNDTRIIEIRVQDKNPAMAKKMVDKIGEIFKEKITNLMRVDNVSIIDEGLLPTMPVKPKSLRNTAIAVISFLLGAAGMAFLLEHLDDRVKTADDVEKNLGMCVLGIIPVSNLK